MILCAAVLAACSSSTDEDSALNDSVVETKTQVTLTFSPYEMSPMTRTATSISGIATHLDVWLIDDNSTTTVHQTSSDTGFGTIMVPLNRLKTYSMVAVAHKCAGSATLTDGIIAFPDDKVTHSMVYKTTFSPATTTSLSCEMQRIVGMLRFEIADQVPDDAYTMRFEMGNRYNRWNISTNTGTNATERVSAFNNFSRDEQTHTAAFSLYVIPTNLTETDEIDVTVKALTEGGDEIESKTFANVPIKAGYKTTYHGQFFTTSSTSASFTIDDWSNLNTIEY